MSGIEVQIPGGILRTYRNQVQGYFETLVLHLTDVLVVKVTQISGRNGHITQKIICVFLIHIYTSVYPVIGKAEIQTYILGQRRFPGKTRIIYLRSVHIIKLISESVLGTITTQIIGSERRIRSGNFLLS